MRALTLWNPFRELEATQNRFSNLLGRPLIPGNGEEAIGAMEWTPLVDVSEDENGFVIKTELPDMKKEDVKVTVVDGALHISGERKFEKEKKGRKYHRIERAYGAFERVFVLPEGVKAGEMNAEFHNGLLEVHLPKAEEAKPKALEIKVS